MLTELLELRQQFEEGRKRLAALKVGGDMMQPGCLVTCRPGSCAVLPVLLLAAQSLCFLALSTRQHETGQYEGADRLKEGTTRREHHSWSAGFQSSPTCVRYCAA